MRLVRVIVALSGILLVGPGCPTADEAEDDVVREPGGTIHVDGSAECAGIATAVWVDHWYADSHELHSQGVIYASADDGLCGHYWQWAEIFAEYVALHEDAYAEYDGPAICHALLDYLTGRQDLEAEMYPEGKCSLGLAPDQDYPGWEGEFCFDQFPSFSAWLTYKHCDWIAVFLDGLDGCAEVTDFSTFVEVHNAAMAEATTCTERWNAVDGVFTIWDLGDDSLFMAGFDIPIAEFDGDGTGTMDFELVAPLCPPPP